MAVWSFVSTRLLEATTDTPEPASWALFSACNVGQAVGTCRPPTAYGLSRAFFRANFASLMQTPDIRLKPTLSPRP